MVFASLAPAANISIDGRDFSIPISKVTLSVYQGPTAYLPVGANRFFFNGTASFALPDGTFTLSAYQGTPVFGGFTVSGGLVTATSGGVTQTGPTSVAALPSALTRVDLATGPLSVPAGLTTVRLWTAATGIAVTSGPVPTAFFLPDATYKLSTYSTNGLFGTFTIAGGTIGGPTGAVTTSGTTVGFDTSRLAAVRVHSAQLTTTASIVSALRVSDPEGVAVISSNDPLLYLPDGTFVVSTYSTLARYGTFVVAGGQVASTAGSITRTSDGIGFDRSTLAQVSFNLASMTNPPSTISYRVTEPGAGVLLILGDGTAWLPSAGYSLTDYSTTVTFGTISVTNTSFAVGGGLEAVAGTVQPRRCGLAVVDVASPVLAAIQTPYTGYRYSVRASLPAGSYALVSNTAQPLGTFTISPALGLTTFNLAAGVSVQPVSCVQDADGDGVEDGADNCAAIANADQVDQDLDGQGDVCDADLDGDGAPNASDVCPLIADSQADLDGDGIGDACDGDLDGDDVPDAVDNCLGLRNTDQLDADADGLGNACDPDDDGDGVPDAADNCALISNADQRDTDADGQGDVCDGDVDGDRVANDVDACPATSPGVLTNDQGCGGIELVALRCVASALRTHGQYVACVAREARAAVAAGLLTQSERARLVAQAARRRAERCDDDHRRDDDRRRDDHRRRERREEERRESRRDERPSGRSPGRR
ncbi:MAG: thrombospondin type 3 repeat-containing protein [Archangium sp.]|nr:thrombospondin type 3 repeat-containing protein [Archangium sp.]